MKKKHFFAVAAVTFIAAAIVTVLISKRPNVDGYASVIPADAKAIVRIDPQQLLQKADLSATDMIKLLRRFFTTDDEERTGLDLARPIFAFVSGGGDMGCVARVDDVTLFEKRLSELKAEGRAGEVTRQGNLSWTFIADQFLLTFDDDKALFMGPATANDDYLRSTMAQLMHQKHDASGMASDLYLDLNSRHAPVVATVTADLLSPEMQSSIKTYLDVSNLSAVRLGAEMHTEANELTLDLDLTSTEKDFSETLEGLNQLLTPISGDLIEHASPSQLLWVCAGIHGDDLLKVLRRSQEARFVLILMNAVADVDAIINDINGDVAIDLIDANTSTPRFMLTAKLKDGSESFKEAPYWMKSAAKAGGYGLRQTSPTDYVFSSDGLELRFGTHDDILYVSSSDKLSLLSDVERANGYIAGQKKLIRGQRFFATIDLTAFDTNTLQEGQLVEPFIGDLQRIEVMMPEVNRLRLRLLAPEGTNIARYLLLSEQDR